MKNHKGYTLIDFIIVIVVVLIFVGIAIAYKDTDTTDEYGYNSNKTNNYNDKTFSIISSSENEDIEEILMEIAKDNKIDLEIEYAGTLDIMEKLNNGEKYDAVWASNSIWLYMLDSSVVKTSESKCTSINPVVFAIKQSKAQELGFVGKDIYTRDIVDAIKAGKLTFSMSNPTRTNTGATAYLGLLSVLAGNPEVLKVENLEDENLKSELVSLFAGLERSSGSEDFLEELFLNGSYEAVVTYESSIININKQLESEGKETLYVLYPIDGVSISDSPFAYIDNGNSNKKEQFLILRDYILSDEGQERLAKTGRRTWFGGTTDNADQSVFNPDWGIDTSKYIVPLKFPSTAVIQKSLALYQSELRKPVFTVFCLDYSGSMYGAGYESLVNAMEYILTQENAEKDLLQYTEKDQIAIIPFSSYVLDTWYTIDGSKTDELLRLIKEKTPGGNTDIYGASVKALNVIKDGVDIEKYNTSIILMTDGQSNMGSYKSLEEYYYLVGKEIPIYSIMFGTAYPKELEEIAELTNGKVFDGRTDLLEAFKEVRGYN